MAQVTCSFCGRNKKDVDLMVSGISAHICNFCIDQAHLILGEEEKTKKNHTWVWQGWSAPKRQTRPVAAGNRTLRHSGFPGDPSTQY